MPEKKIKLTRPELKRYRDALARYQRYLPMLKLKQQRLQLAVRDIVRQRRAAEQAAEEMDTHIRRYHTVFGDRLIIPLHRWAKPSRLVLGRKNIAGVEIPVLHQVLFPEVRYSLFATPPWVDQALLDLREKSRREALVDVLREQERLLQKELSRIIQRVNLFEKVMIPHAKEAIRRIRIKLGDEMRDAVGRAKIAKKKLAAALAEDVAQGQSLPAREEAV
ncbi:MAG: V-type ATP synthase subunit D [Thermoguttaceae bacterium]|nr:V-type ATP synthase subunit D [Thermoguttaceae bacterium]MDW8078888.1 V-type ATP synthase subunit D [Thermoguttaceae bacterium]